MYFDGITIKTKGKYTVGAFHNLAHGTFRWMGRVWGEIEVKNKLLLKKCSRDLSISDAGDKIKEVYSVGEGRYISF